MNGLFGLEKLASAIANRLPRKVVYFALCRAAGETTTGRYGSTIMSEHTLMECVERWNKADSQSFRERDDILKEYEKHYGYFIRTMILKAEPNLDEIILTAHEGTVENFFVDKGLSRTFFLSELEKSIHKLRTRVYERAAADEDGSNQAVSGSEDVQGSY